ncbi:hypothetical protein ISO77_17555 [Morganella morganii subsp. morganii]|uniref:hypothetical protein n=1 Tax=Morganella morganii TaxID=582 RepID=UPI001BD9E7D6|nr:hypothetical protein [Morganella morganii]MBT0397329.1 hypothetical protein [Morganella morganii subsp. morganii]
MDITIKIELDEKDFQEIATILNCDECLIPDTMEKLAIASIHEYLTMIRGQKVFKRGTDILEYRLFLLIQHHFKDKIPEEREVSALFQTTLTESRSLIRAVISKYQYLLRASVNNTMKAVLENASQESEEDPYEVIINSQNIVDELNKLIADIDGTLPSVAKKRGSVSTYEIKNSSYKKLLEKLTINE